jgi:hypothetical protein
MIKTGSLVLAALALDSVEAISDLAEISGRDELDRRDPAGRPPRRRERIRENERRAAARFKTRAGR